MEIVWSDLGAGLFRAVLEYVEDNYGENVARQTFHRITEKVEQLEHFPGIGVKDFDLEPTEFGSSAEVRHLILYPNIVYYLIDGDEVVIIAVLHALQSRETVRKIVASFIEKYK